MFFAQTGDDVVIDQIPLAEITTVREMQGADDDRPESEQANEVMIETHPEGYNSGRAYYLQAGSELLCKNLIKSLSTYSAAAHERAQAQSAFAQTQRRVDRVYRSSPFQSFLAFLIVAVIIFIYFSSDPNLRFLIKI